MSEVTYYVALPFVPSDDRIAPGQAIECFKRPVPIRKCLPVGGVPRTNSRAALSARAIGARNQRFPTSLAFAT